VHAVDSVELAAELGKRAGDHAQALLLAVNLANEATKGGVTAETAPALAKAIAEVPNVTLAGLMTMPPPDIDPLPQFEQLRDLRARIADALGRALPVLSMGMSGDFEAAIACGATHVRIGTAIFGERPKTEPA
jgi:pyridoxal phosphate enzyme (YggS family)